jgi:putative ABC transport system permease protein
VLGFTKAEVALLLLGEQGVLTLVALPVGFLLGYGMCAMLSAAVQNELFRMPLVVSSETLAFSAVVVVGSALMSGLLVRRRIYRLDMIEVLKTRE